MPNAPYDAVAFDLDGTLIDSREDLATGVNAVREELGLAALDVPRVVEMVGKGSRNLVRRALAEENPDGAPEGEAFEHAYGRFLDLYHDRCLETTRLYDGVAELLDGLGEREVPLAVVTNKPLRHTGTILEGMDLARRFRCFLGGDSLAVKKPDPAPLLLAARRLEVSPERLLFVGDSETDGETARRAGCPLVLVEWGFAGPGELDPFECVLRAERPEEITDLVRRGAPYEAVP